MNRRAQLRDQFLDRVGFVAKALLTKIAIEAAFVPGPVTQLVRDGRRVAVRVPEGLKRRHLHMVGRDAVKGPVTAVPDMTRVLAKNSSARAIR